MTVVATPPATKHVTGSNHVRVHVSADARTGRVLALGVLDNLVKGAAGQAVQAFNLVHGLPETAGLEQLPLVAVTIPPPIPPTTGPRPRPDAPLGAADRSPAGRAPTAIPAGFRAGGAAAGIKASGRPDLAIIATLPDESGRAVPASAAAVFTPNAFAAAPVRLSQAHLRQTSATGRGSYGLAEAIISTSGSANAATGAAGDADQAVVAGVPRRAVGSPRSGRCCSRRRDRDPAAARPGRGRDRRAGPCARRDRRGLAAAADALRTTDTRTKAATVTFDAARPGRPRGSPDPRHRHRERRRDDPSADGDDARRSS